MDGALGKPEARALIVFVAKSVPSQGQSAPHYARRDSAKKEDRFPAGAVHL
jgi:hypothetical protein